MRGLTIRSPEAGDIDTVHWIVASVGSFTPEEAEAAFALVEKSLNGLVNDEGELAYILEDAGVPVGFVCFGPTPQTVGTWGLHAVGVEQSGQRRGYGRHLLAYAEADARRRGGRLMIAETALRGPDEGAGSFYARAGYTLVARIPGFYAPDEDKLVYLKALESVHP